MKKRGILGLLVISILLISIMSISFVSAGLLGDIWNKITGKVTENITEENITSEPEEQVSPPEPTGSSGGGGGTYGEDGEEIVEEVQEDSEEPQAELEEVTDETEELIYNDKKNNSVTICTFSFLKIIPLKVARKIKANKNIRFIPTGLRFWSDCSESLLIYINNAFKMRKRNIT